MQAFDAGDVTHELWNSNQNAARDSIGRFAKFVCPTVANGKVYIATFSGKLDVYGILPTAIADNNTNDGLALSNGKNDFEIFPNPAKNQVNIRYKAGAAQHVSIMLLNNLGQEVFETTENLLSGNNTVSINFPATIQAGIYMLQIVNEAGILQSAKLVIESN